jgi:hypothetical protein
MWWLFLRNIVEYKIYYIFANFLQKNKF